MDIATGLICIFIGFISQYMDVSVGMGYGTFTAPLLLLLGVPPIYAVPAILLSKVVLGLLSGGAHQIAGNVQRGVLLSLVLTGIAGTAFGAVLSILLPEEETSALIGLIMMVAGFLALFYTVRGIRMGSYSAYKIRISGFLAGFANGVSGGGYGAINTTGLILGGVNPSTAVGSTLLSEAGVALFGISLYGFLIQELKWDIILPLLVGGIVATPLGVLSTRKAPSKRLAAMIGLAVLSLGALSAQVRSEAFVSGFVLITLILIAYHLLMVGYLRVRVAIGGANLGAGFSILLLVHLIRTGVITVYLPPLSVSILLYGLVFSGSIYLLAGFLNVTVKP